jgi:hypothetical protein
LYIITFAHIVESIACFGLCKWATDAWIEQPEQMNMHTLTYGASQGFSEGCIAPGVHRMLIYCHRPREGCQLNDLMSASKRNLARTRIFGSFEVISHGLVFRRYVLSLMWPRSKLIQSGGGEKHYLRGSWLMLVKVPCSDTIAGSMNQMDPVSCSSSHT